MSKEAMEAVLANSKTKPGLRGYLLALAWKTYDKTPIFTGPFTVRYIATLANVEHRQAQTAIARLKKMGELVITGKQGREYVYGVNVALANYAVSDVDNYAVSDVVDDGGDANYAVSDVDNYAVSDVDNYAASDVLTTQYPAFGSYKETRNKIEQEVTSQPPSRSKIAQNGAEADAEQTLPPYPPPQPSLEVRALWLGILEIMKAEFGEAQQDNWLKKIVPGWSGPGILCLRVSGSFNADTIRSRYRAGIEAAAWKITGKKVIVEVRPI